MAVKIAPGILPDPQKLEYLIEACKRNKQIFIPGEVPSSKNTLAAVIHSNGKQRLHYTKFTREYIKATQWYYKMFARDFLAQSQDRDFPLRVNFTLHRRTRQRFDYLNIGQIVQDMMVKSGYLPDDSSEYLVPSFSPAVHDKELFGVWIKLL